MEDETSPAFDLRDWLEPAQRPVEEASPSAPVLADRYRLGAVIGTGATATVHRAFDRVLRREVAIKLFDRGQGVDERRQAQEIRILSQLQHPGLVALYDTGTYADKTFLAMELVEGPTLAARIRQGALPAGETVELGAQLADALAYVHARGVTHRDLKPHNVLLGPHRPMLSDFGIAQVLDATRLTASGVVIGTAAYLAPEQVRSNEVAAPADIFALGLVLLECVTGRREYPGPMAEAAVARLQRLPAVPRDLPHGLSRLLEWMTVNDPAERPTAAEVAEALRSGGAGVPTIPFADRKKPERTKTPAISGRRKLIALAGAPLAAVVIVGALMANANAPTAPSSGTVTGPSPAPGAPPEQEPVTITAANAGKAVSEPAAPGAPAKNQESAATGAAPTQADAKGREKGGPPVSAEPEAKKKGKKEGKGRGTTATTSVSNPGGDSAAAG
ncbi:serine/threonine-protein kinase [Amycolatopsis anabasis]|uniref:serine/threonine-protein kinase n=1 Tax=Amycolatopsis anabasis TaxID=1840409 RepID=UPI001C555A75|nr:serine/threonine-protein kinase [Amycolatopsis anabasis]